MKNIKEIEIVALTPTQKEIKMCLSLSLVDLESANRYEISVSSEQLFQNETWYGHNSGSTTNSYGFGAKLWKFKNQSHRIGQSDYGLCPEFDCPEDFWNHSTFRELIRYESSLQEALKCFKEIVVGFRAHYEEKNKNYQFKAESLDKINLLALVQAALHGEE